MSRELEVFDAPGLPADWLNAWLAAIGVTVLLPDVKLSWTDDVIPTARFWVSDAKSLIARLDGAIPTRDRLEQTTIASTPHGASHAMSRAVDLVTYADRAALARARDDGLLAASVTDLVELDNEGNVASGPFNPPVPKGITLAKRAWTCAKEREEKELSVAPTLLGLAKRFKGNGLGFDPKRLSGGAESLDNFTDPVLELLVFSSFPLFPLRGDGLRTSRQRGWAQRPTRRGAFRWSSWNTPLDCWAIDAFLDSSATSRSRNWSTVPYVPSNKSDPTRAYFSEPDS